MYAQVCVDIAHENIDRTFDYRIKEGMSLTPGQRVLVPFGGKVLKEAYVIRLSSTTQVPEEKLKEVAQAIDTEPVIIPPLMDLAEWMHQTCRCLYVDALRLMIPTQMRGNRIHPLEEWQVCCSLSGEALEKALASLKRAPRQRALLQRLKPEWQSVQRLGSGALPVVRTLCEKGYAQMQKAEKLRKPYAHMEIPGQLQMEYSPEQIRAIEEIKGALAVRAGAFLLHGVTGSGKTEVYIQAIEACLKQERTAILLVPEISLTPQMVQWFRARFGDRAAVLHSGLGAGERFDEWRRLRRGEADVVIGARSAIFAPVSNLGLIIIDEEHETSYQSDRTPQYDAREVALRRAKQENAVLVMGSATPSVQTFAKALRRIYTLLEMPNRVAQRPLPQVHVVDMRMEMVKGNRGIFSSLLYRELEKTLERGEQAILFMNRRGYHSFVSCRTCGKSIKCPSCDVTLTYHLPGPRLRCHYCGYEQHMPDACPQKGCGSRYIKCFGTGTQMVEQQVKKYFPGIKVIRVDMDTTRGKDAHEKLFSAFRAGQSQVLVGTQMVAKGLDFPNVTFVGVVAADTSLNLPDYRSEERTFQLLTQVAGRAGRGVRPGTVVVQTYTPEHYAIQLAADQNYRAFFETEMTRRRRELYPPYTVIARVLAVSPSVDLARKCCMEIEAQIRQLMADYPKSARQVVQVRAMEAPISRIQEMNRWQVFIKLYAKGPWELFIERMRDLTLEAPPEVQLVLEVNPNNMI